MAFSCMLFFFSFPWKMQKKKKLFWFKDNQRVRQLICCQREPQFCRGLVRSFPILLPLLLANTSPRAGLLLFRRSPKQDLGPYPEATLQLPFLEVAAPEFFQRVRFFPPALGRLELAQRKKKHLSTVFLRSHQWLIKNKNQFYFSQNFLASTLRLSLGWEIVDQLLSREQHCHLLERESHLQPQPVRLRRKDQPSLQSENLRKTLNRGCILMQAEYLILPGGKRNPWQSVLLLIPLCSFSIKKAQPKLEMCCGGEGEQLKESNAKMLLAEMACNIIQQIYSNCVQKKKEKMYPKYLRIYLQAQRVPRNTQLNPELHVFHSVEYI